MLPLAAAARRASILKVRVQPDQRQNQITFRSMTPALAFAALIARVGLLLAGRFRSAQARRPTFLNNLPPASERECARRHVLGNHRAGPDIGSGPDLDRRDQGRVRADEGILA